MNEGIIEDSFNQKQDFGDTKRNEIKEKYYFSDADNKSLIEKQSTLTTLQQTNYEDKIGLLTQNNTRYSEFTDKISNVVKNLGEYSQNLKSSLDAYKRAKVKNDKALLQSQILKSLPLMRRALPMKSISAPSLRLLRILLILF